MGIHILKYSTVPTVDGLSGEEGGRGRGKRRVASGATKMRVPGGGGKLCPLTRPPDNVGGKKPSFFYFYLLFS